MALLERWLNDEVWRWPILAGLAILLGAGIGLVMSSDSTDSPPAPPIHPPEAADRISEGQASEFVEAVAAKVAVILAKRLQG